MDGWLIGLVAVAVLGVAAILYGALSDRARHRRQVAELTSVPDRDIPRFTAAAAPPRYLSELQARRAPSTSAPEELDRAGRERLEQALRSADTVRVPFGYASRDFANDAATGRAVLFEPWVLVCAEPLTSLRELIGVLERTALADRALVVLAPAIDRDLLGTLEVNRIRRLMKIVVVLGRTPEPVDEVCAATGAGLVSRSDLQAGYLPEDALGRCGRWVSDARTSQIVRFGPD